MRPVGSGGGGGGGGGGSGCCSGSKTGVNTLLPEEK